jgi:cytochrome c peroxidase
MRIIYLLFIAFTLGFSQSDTDLMQKVLSKGLKPIPKDFATLKKIVDDPNNAMTKEKIYLGKKLFFDKNLSKSRKIACAKCHNFKKGGADGLPTAVGHNGLKNPSHLNSPTVFNTAFSKHFFWDGRAKSLEEQAKGPTQAPFEMASTPELIEQRVKENPEYIALFDKVFGPNSITFDNITKAIAVYEKTLVTRGAFDRFLEGDSTALDQSAKRGLNLFIDLGCKGCHFGYAVGGQKIQKFPLRGHNSILNIHTIYDDVKKKREVVGWSMQFKMYKPFPFENVGGFMGKDGAKKFRVPILRNIEKTGPYFHNGIVKTLQDAIKIMANNQIGVELNKQQVSDIEAFLKSLSGTLVEYNLSR